MIIKRLPPFVKRRLPLASAIFFLTFVIIVISTLAPDAEDIERKKTTTDVTIPSDSTLYTDNYYQSLKHEYITETYVVFGDVLSTALERMGVNDPQLQNFLQKTPFAQSIFNLYAGRLLQAKIDSQGRVIWLRYMHTPGSEEEKEVFTRFLEIQRTAKGFTAKEMEIPTERKVTAATAVITSSLFGATDSAGIPDPIAIQIAETLATDIDFHKDLRKGDAFRVLYEVYTHDGQYVRSGRILALEFINNRKHYEAVWYQANPAEKGGYYTLEGKQLRKTFRRSPLAFSRVTSGFSRRLHPIFKTWRNHTGVDYGAPTGTPIMTVADGVVIFVGQKGGYGNAVEVRHSGDYSTLYAHMSRFNPSIRVGSKVTQDDVIGYVGSTGYATGPHLHYEFRIKNVPVDPLKQVLPQPAALAGATLKKFMTDTAELRAQLSVLKEVGDAMAAAEKTAK